MSDLCPAVDGLATLRSALGVMLVAHAGLKFGVLTMQAFSGLPGSVGLPPAPAFLVVA
ncbi:MAG: hypothetical protein NT037_00455 [Hyphomicrobiales bacterium]|nr:hypothetical protein [Hyphomicrobiales bacterium]